ncbi:MAG TPA: tetratricopeptide repeat protein [Terriglobales bacterium]
MRRGVSIALWLLLVILTLLLLPMRTVGQAPAPNLTAAELERQGDQLRAARSYSDALVYYRAALAKAPEDAPIWNKAGMADLELGRLAEAENDFRRATKLMSKFAQARNNLGALKYMRKDFKGAIREYERALQLEPDNASYHNNLAAALFERKQTARAVAEYSKAYQLDPGIFERTMHFGTVAQMRSPEDRAAFYFLVAKLYAQSGNLDGALEYLKKAQEEGYRDMKKVYTDAEFAKLRNDPRLQQILKRKPEELPK